MVVLTLAALAGAIGLYFLRDIVEEARDAIAIARKVQEGELTKIAEILASAKQLRDGESIAIIVGDAAFELSRVRVTFEQPGDSREHN